MHKMLFIPILLITFKPAYAMNDVVNTPVQNTITHASQVYVTKAWNLDATEWDHYLKLMQGPAGHYYQHLSPPEVLGLSANTPNDLNHFAEIAAKLEHDKLEHELQFNAAFHAAAARLYSKEPLIKPFDYTPFTPIPK